MGPRKRFQTSFRKKKDTSVMVTEINTHLCVSLKYLSWGLNDGLEKGSPRILLAQEKTEISDDEDTLRGHIWLNTMPLPENATASQAT